MLPFSEEYNKRKKEPFSRAARVVNKRKRTMSKFTPEEISYLQSQRLGRLATVSEQDEPTSYP